MYLNLQVLNSDATLNNFYVLDSQRFSGGANFDLVLRLIQPDKKLRYIPAVGATISITFKKSDNTTITKSGTFVFSEDRSIFKISLSALETPDLISQNLKAVLDESGIISHAILEAPIQKTTTQCQGI